MIDQPRPTTSRRKIFDAVTEVAEFPSFKLQSLACRILHRFSRNAGFMEAKDPLDASKHPQRSFVVELPVDELFGLFSDGFRFGLSLDDIEASDLLTCWRKMGFFDRATVGSLP